MNFFQRYKLKKLYDHGELPDEVRQYVEINLQPPSKLLPLDEVRFVVFDTEATGLNPKRDKIISIGAVTIRHLDIDIQDSFETLIKQDDSGDKETVPVHGILRRELKAGGANEKGALECFLGYIQNSILVAHHGQFDINILNETLQLYYPVRILNNLIDTAHVAKRLEYGPMPSGDSKPGDYSLDNLCKRYHIPLTDRHTAPGDALLTARLLQVLLYKAKKKGIDTVGKLL